MAGLENQTIEGFNSQLKTIKKLKEDYPENEYIVSVTYFEDDVSDIIRFGKIENIPLLNRENYQPGSTTALLDAIGKSVEAIREKFEKEINKDLATVVVVILTDGHENASRYYSYEQISKIIEELNATKKWIFTFLGAGINASSITNRIKIHARNVASFDKTEYSAVLDRVSRSVRYSEEKKNAGLFDTDFLMD
jgi:uncharacterized protein YegL